MGSSGHSERPSDAERAQTANFERPSTYIDLYTMEYVTITKYHGIRNTMNIGPLYHEQIDNIRNAVHRATIKS